MAPGPTLPNYDLLCNLDGNLSCYASERSRRKELEAALKTFESFFVVNVSAAVHLANIQATVDAKVDFKKQGIILWLSTESDSVPVMKRLLQLGVHPDIVSGFKDMTASHWASHHGLAGVAEILGVCRPDLLVEETDFRATPEELANKYAREKEHESEKTRFLRTALVWKEFAVNGFPSIAQLTAEEKYWAVQNLCRRRVVPELEKEDVWRGKTAIEWARWYGKVDLERELEYLLEISHRKKEGNDLERNADTDDVQKVSQLVSLALSVTSKAEEVGGLKQEALLKLALAEEKIERLKLQQEVSVLKCQIGKLQQGMRGNNSGDHELMDMQMERDSVLVAEMRNAVEELFKLPSAVQSSIADMISAFKKAQN